MFWLKRVLFVLLAAVLAAGFVCGFAEDGEDRAEAYPDFGTSEGGIISMKDTVTEGETIEITFTFPEEHGIVATDWMGIYRYEVDETNVKDGDGINIWCYVGTNTRTPGAAEELTVTVFADEDIAEADAYDNYNWPLEPGDYKVLLFYNDSFEVADSFEFTVEEKVRVTAAPTATPETTEAPAETVAPAEETAAAETEEAAAETAEIAGSDGENKTEGGCGGILSGSSAIIMCAVLFVLKKH